VLSRFAQTLDDSGSHNFPAVWGFGWGVNDFGIATVTYVSDLDGNCPHDTYASCAGAIQLH
jgi:hypothetical protein